MARLYPFNAEVRPDSRPALTCPVIYVAPVSGVLFEGPERNESVNIECCGRWAAEERVMSFLS